jgi:hypothetical protein
MLLHRYIDCTPPDFTNGIHSSVECVELCAHIIINSNSLVTSCIETAF